MSAPAGTPADSAAVIYNLVSGLAGAVLGLCGAFVLQWRQNRSDKKAAARATFMELASNTATLTIMHVEGIYVPFLETTTWRDTRGKLADMLRPKEFAVVGTAYMRIEALLAAWQAYQPRDRLTIEERVTVEQAFDRVDCACFILEERGWAPGERAELRAELRKLAMPSTSSPAPEDARGTPPASL